MDIQKLYVGVMAPLAPFKAYFKDRFKTHPTMRIRALSTTNLNPALSNSIKYKKTPKH